MKPELLASILHNPKLLSLDEANWGLDITALCKRVLVINQDNLIYEYDGSLDKLLTYFVTYKEINLELEYPFPI